MGLVAAFAVRSSLHGGLCAQPGVRCLQRRDLRLNLPLEVAPPFGVLGFAGGGSPDAGQIQQIGFGIAAGVLMDTFLARTLLVPTVVILLGRWNWWPSPLFKQSAVLQPGGEIANSSIEASIQLDK